MTDLKENMTEQQTGGSEAENLAMAQFVMTSRLYDVLMAQLNETNPVLAERIAAVHKEGHLLTSEPNFSGIFIGSLTDKEIEEQLSEGTT